MSFVIIAEVFGTIAYRGVNHAIQQGSWYDMDSGIEPLIFSSSEEASRCVLTFHKIRKIVTFEEFEVMQVMAT